MNSLKRKSALAAVLLAIGATAFGAQAADTGTTTGTPQFQSIANQLTAGSVASSAPVAQTRAQANASKQLFAFEKGVEQLGAPSLTTADRHNYARRLNNLPSPFDSYDLASPGG